MTNQNYFNLYPGAKEGKAAVGKTTDTRPRKKALKEERPVCSIQPRVMTCLLLTWIPDCPCKEG